MARVTKVNKARKDIIEDGTVIVAKGETYYHWTLGFRGRKRISKTYPDKRQLTQSDYQLRLFDFEDQVNAISGESPEDLQTEVESLISDIEDYKQELQDNLDNVPDQLRDTHINNERIEELDSVISEFENIDFDYEEKTNEEIRQTTDVSENAGDADLNEKRAEMLENWVNEKLEEIQGIGIG